MSSSVKENDYGTYFLRLLWQVDGMIHMKHLEQCLAHGRWYKMFAIIIIITIFYYLYQWGGLNWH